MEWCWCQQNNNNKFYFKIKGMLSTNILRIKPNIGLIWSLIVELWAWHWQIIIFKLKYNSYLARNHCELLHALGQKFVNITSFLLGFVSHMHFQNTYPGLILNQSDDIKEYQLIFSHRSRKINLETEIDLKISPSIIRD